MRLQTKRCFRENLSTGPVRVLCRIGNWHIWMEGVAENKFLSAIFSSSRGWDLTCKNSRMPCTVAAISVLWWEVFRKNLRQRERVWPSQDNFRAFAHERKYLLLRLQILNLTTKCIWGKFQKQEKKHFWLVSLLWSKALKCKFEFLSLGWFEGLHRVVSFLGSKY